MSIKDQLLHARELIKAKRYDEARAILVHIDHPTAKQWLDSLDEIAPPTKNKRSYVDPEFKTKNKAAPERDPMPLSGLLMLMAATLILGIGGGLIVFVISKAFYIIFIQIIFSMFTIGALFMSVVYWGKVRVAIVVGLLGIVTGGLFYGTYRYAEYLDYCQQSWQSVLDEVKADPEWEGYTQIEIEKWVELSMEEETGVKGYDGFLIMLNQYLVDETGSGGFVGYIKLELMTGMVTETYSRYSGHSTNQWSSETTVLYWIFEIALMTIGVAAFGVKQAVKEFCNETNDWLNFKQIGGVNGRTRHYFLAALKAHDYAAAGKMMRHPDSKGDFFIVDIGRCSMRSPSARLIVKVHEGRSTRKVINTVISAEDYQALRGK